jgi:hypothetical protein
MAGLLCPTQVTSVSFQADGVMERHDRPSRIQGVEEMAVGVIHHMIHITPDKRHPQLVAHILRQVPDRTRCERGEFREKANGLIPRWQDRL